MGTEGGLLKRETLGHRTLHGRGRDQLWGGERVQDRGGRSRPRQTWPLAMHQGLGAAACPQGRAHWARRLPSQHEWRPASDGWLHATGATAKQKTKQNGTKSQERCIRHLFPAQLEYNSTLESWVIKPTANFEPAHLISSLGSITPCSLSPPTPFSLSVSSSTCLFPFPLFLFFLLSLSSF